uniref:MAM domain-containing protein n=1 Tax=Plectus sambesii TaxID=2011161 RepID=A0A914WLV7_9BILA
MSALFVSLTSTTPYTVVASNYFEEDNSGKVPNLDMINPWHTRMDSYAEMNAEAVYNASLGLNRQDSLDDALQFIMRDQNNGQILSAQPSQQPELPPTSFGENDLNFEGSLADLGDYEKVLNLPNNVMDTDALEQCYDFKKEQDVLFDLMPAVYSPPGPASVQEQAVPTPTSVEADDQQPTHVLRPGLRTPVPLNRYIKAEPNSVSSPTWSSSRPTRPQSVSVQRIKAEYDVALRDSATPDDVFSSDGSCKIALPKPRKYERKPEPVKSTMTYKEKRAKNNDAHFGLSKRFVTRNGRSSPQPLRRHGRIRHRTPCPAPSDMHRYLSILLVCILHKVVLACFPFALDGLSQANAAQTVLGEQTRIGTKLALGSVQTSAAISKPEDLVCFEFNDLCRWRNVEGLFIDELDWYRGSGFLDSIRLQAATGTQVSPKAPYAIAATSTALSPTAQAVLVSDTIPCQNGDGEVRLKYWTSPQVRISVCAKRSFKAYGEFDYCSPTIENGDPGPAFINIPGPIQDPFEIYIRAENFVFQSGDLAGGFAIVDDLEYYADLCQTATGGNSINELPIPTINENDRGGGSGSSGGSSGGSGGVDQELVPFQPRPGLPDFGGNGIHTDPFGDPIASPATLPALPSLFRESATSRTNSACSVLTCSFSEGECLTYMQSSDWAVSNQPVGNPLTGIRGDASKLPFNEKGAFAYVAGPLARVRLTTPNFTLPTPSNLMFAYYKASRDTGFQVATKRRDQTEEEVIFQAPVINRDSRRWFREARTLPPGDYDYVAFDSTNLRQNTYVGLDELNLLDATGQPLC